MKNYAVSVALALICSFGFVNTAQAEIVIGEGAGGVDERIEFTSGGPGHTSVFLRVSGSAVERGRPDQIARAFLSRNRESLGFNDALELRHSSTQSDELGFTHVRLEQRHGNIPVFGSQLIVHMRQAAGGYRVESVNGRAFPQINLPTRPIVTKEMASSFARSSLRLTNPSEGELVVLPWAGTLSLAWHFTFELPEEPARHEVFVDAISPEILLRYDSILHAHGATTGNGAGVSGASRTFHTFHHTDNLYYLWDTSRPFYSPTLAFNPFMALGDVLDQGVIATYLEGIAPYSDADNSWGDPPAVDAHFFAGKTEEYYRTKLGLSSYDDNGTSLLTAVLSGEGCDAFWTGAFAVFDLGGDCDGDGSLDLRPMSGAVDVVAHEFTHGLIQSTANLLSLNQSGAMGEAYPDYFGNVVENNFEGVPGDGRIGEDLCLPGNSICLPQGGVRDMNNTLTMDDHTLFPEFIDNGGIHVNSQIYSAVLWEIRERLSVTPGGREFADRINHRALATYLLPLSEFADGRDATLQAARDLSATPGQIDIINQEFDENKIGWSFINSYEPVGSGAAVQFGPQHSPAVSGTRIAWVDDLDQKVHVFDTAGGTEEIYGTGVIESVDVSGTRLVWSEDPNPTSPSSRFRIRTVVLPGGTPSTVSTVSSADHVSPRIDGADVVWNTFTATDIDIFWDDLSNADPPAAVSAEIDLELVPVVGHDGSVPWVAWMNFDPSLELDVYTKMLPAGSVLIRTSAGADQGLPDISGRNVVYLEDADLDGLAESVKKVDVDTGAPVSIATTSTDFGPAAIDGSLIAYSEFVLTGQSGYDLLSNNLTGTNEQTISAARGWQIFPSISGSRIVWRDTQNLDSDVYSNMAVESVAPTITSQSPLPGATGVGIAGSVDVTFSEAMDVRSLNPGTFSLVPQGVGVDVPGRVLVNSINGASFDPFIPLEGGTSYEASIGPPARDTRGNKIAAPATWSFTTAVPDGIQYLPEGATHSGFTTFLLLANPSPTNTATAFVTFLTPNGPVAPEDVQGIEIAPRRRTTVNVNTALGFGTDAAVRVTSFGAAVVAEVSMHKAGSLAAMDMAAAGATSPTWIIPEGATHSGFTTFVSIANPDMFNPAQVDLTFLTGGLGSVPGPQNEVIPPGGRRTFNVNASVPGQDVSTRITADTGSVVAGMSLHKQGPNDLAIGGSLGTPAPADIWVVPEGATHSGFSTFVLVANPGATPASVAVTYLTGSQGAVADPDPFGTGSATIPAGTRRTINVNSRLAALGKNADDVSTLLDSTSGSVAVEASVQKQDSSGFVIADSVSSGGSTINAASGTSWLAAEGATHSGFTTFVLIANPNQSQSAIVDVAFLTPSGTQAPTDLQNLVINPGSRRTISVNLYLPGQDASTLVTTDSGVVVVEMSIDRVAPGVGFSKGRSLAFRLAA